MNIAERIEVQVRLRTIEEQIACIREIVDNPEEVGDPTACPHPEDKIVEVTTMGTLPTWKCLVCNEERNVPFYN
jgi:hypothetical protein